jgi:GAF domain/ANTAR domain
VQDDLDPERVSRVVAALAVGERDPQRSLCSASAEVVGVSGAGIVLVSAGRMLGSVCVSNTVVEAVEELQYTLGEGPCIDAYRTRKPVLEPDLAAPESVRWPGFRQGAVAAGARAAFGFPLLIGDACIGALNLFRDASGPLRHEQYLDALVVARVASRTVLGWQSIAGSDSVAWQLEQVPAHRAVVHQASGMISVQAGVPVGDALVMLRAHAFAAGRTMSEVASDVVNRELVFDGAGPEQPI